MYGESDSHPFTVMSPVVLGLRGHYCFLFVPSGPKSEMSVLISFTGLDLDNIRQLEVVCLKETKKMSLISSKSGN